MIIQKKIIYVKYFFLFLIFLSYLTGFFLRENIAGGSENDFTSFTWPVILAFKNNFFDTLSNYGIYGEGNIPLFHIMNAYLNPFTKNQITFQASIALISLLNVLFFSQILKDKYQFNKIDALFYASLLLTLPFFRSSAFWGLTENLGWLFLILSIKYFIKFKITKKNPTILIFLICFFSSLALYTRQYLIFFPIFIILYSIFYKNFKLLKYSSIFYILFAIPGLILLYLWGGVIKIGATQTDQVNLLNYHNPKFILKNILIFFSIFIFYYIPFELSKILNKQYLNPKKIILIILSTFFLLYFLNILNIFDYLNNEKLGGGVFLKLSQLIFDKNLIPFLCIASLGFAGIFNLINISKKNFILMISLIIFCFPKFILQEYFEPLFFILFFTIFEYNLVADVLRKNKTQFIFFGYFTIYLFGSYFYRYFLNPI